MAEYAVVAYLNGALADFAERLRQQLAPEQAHLRAHITLLPPRALSGAEKTAVTELSRFFRSIAPLRVSVDVIETFLPLHPTVYLRVLHGARHLRAIYSDLNSGALSAADPWAYVPHLTLATLPDRARTETAFAIAAEHWRQYTGEREFILNEATFVREDAPDRWLDIESLAFGT